MGIYTCTDVYIALVSDPVQNTPKYVIQLPKFKSTEKGVLNMKNYEIVSMLKKLNHFVQQNVDHTHSDIILCSCIYRL